MECKLCGKNFEYNDIIWNQVRLPTASEDYNLKPLEYDRYHFECAISLNLVPENVKRNV